MKTKKNLLLTLIFCILIFQAYSIPKPKKNKPVGACIGKLTIIILNDMKQFKAGTYHRANIYLRNKATGKDKILYSNPTNGYFKFLNVEPGEYIFYRFDFEYRTSNIIYNMDYMGFSEDGRARKVEDGIPITILPNAITSVDSVTFSIGLFDDAESGFYNLVVKKIDYKDEQDKQKEYFSTIDPKGFWNEFKWSKTPKKAADGE